MAHSTRFSGGVCHSLSKTSGGEDLEIEQPVSCWDGSSFDFHATLPSMRGPTLIRDEVIQVGQPRQNRLLAAFGMMEALHHEQLPLDGVMGLIQQCTGHGHLWVCEDRIPARLLLLEPAPDPLPMSRPGLLRHMVGEVASPLAQGNHPQTLTLTRPVQEGVELRAECLAHRRRDRREFARELVDGVAETVPQARFWKQ